MIILGIHDGHNCGATILKDGEVQASVCEERLTRNKNEVGYPRLSIDEVLSLAGVMAEDLDEVVYASEYMHTKQHLLNVSQWYRAGRREQNDESGMSPDALRSALERRQGERIHEVVDHIGVHPSRVSFVEHHLAHGAAAYFGSPFDLDEDTLVLTCDGSGDNVSATVAIASRGSIRRIAQTGRNDSLGKIYSRITFHLGLKPWEHEYKVMGLAPYADEKYAREVEAILDGYLRVRDDGLGFEAAGSAQTSYIYDRLREDLELKRFDAISGGVQFFTEKLLTTWVKNAVAHTGIGRVVCGGGVFMNVKANKLLSELEGVKDIFVFPSCGDESLSMGAAWVKYFELNPNIENQKKMKHIYLGRAYRNEDISTYLNEEDLDGVDVSFITDIEQEIATLLSKNEVVARFAGRMEWGARALGNRSILTNPKEWPNVERINSMIKMRDFWMPFAPSMIEEYAHDYIINPKSLSSPYMMFAFDTNRAESANIAAATHPRDKTARAQIVTRTGNPSYWNLINKFRELTGTAVVLNTSFNLHGYPLVMSPKDALSVFKKSGLNYLALENYMLSKKNKT